MMIYYFNMKFDLLEMVTIFNLASSLNKDIVVVRIDEINSKMPIFY